MFSRFTKVFVALLCLGLAGSFVAMSSEKANAVSATDFNAGYIISDEVFYDKNAMSLAEIEAFINSHTVSCDTWGTGAVGSGRYINGRAVDPNTSRADYARQMMAAGYSRYHEPPYICLTNYYENPNTHVTSFDTRAQKLDGMLSAAEIIYKAAQTYGINPQVLLVMLKKEYGPIYTDNWPLRDQYNTVMGYACPDTGPNNTANCNEKYYGFYNQVMDAAWQLNYYKEHINQYSYQPNRINTISYSTSSSCGSKQVYIENIATASLYIYTPYVPNDAALAAYPGEAPCGSYGNRNFFMFFNEWFGSTYSNIKKVDVIAGDFHVATWSDANKTVQPLQTRSVENALTVGTKNGNDIDTFEIRRNSDGTYTLVNASTGWAVDVPVGVATAGAILQQYPANDTAAQKWYIYQNDNGSYSIASTLNRDLVISRNGDGILELAEYDQSEAQSFRLVAKQQTEIGSGKYAIASAISNDHVIDIYGGGTSAGTRAQIYNFNRTDAQIFEFRYDATTGWYEIVNPNSGKVLDVANGSTSNGTPIQLWDKNNTCAQKWQIISDGTGKYEIISACSGRALDIYNASPYNYAKLQIYDRNGTNAQKWILKEIEEIPVSEETQVLADGTYVINSALASNYVLDIAWGGTANFTNVWMYANNGTAAQKFEISYDKDTKYYTIKSPYSGRVLDVYNGGRTNGSNVQIYDSNGTCAQQWIINADANGQYEILSACSGLALDVAGGEIKLGTNVQLYSRNGTKSQLWSFQAAK